MQELHAINYLAHLSIPTYNIWNTLIHMPACKSTLFNLNALKILKTGPLVKCMLHICISYNG